MGDYSGIGEAVVGLCKLISRIIAWILIPLAVVGLISIAGACLWFVSMIQVTWKG